MCRSASRRWRSSTEGVQLHASEEFGRLLAEGMLFDTVAAATDFSGPREASTAETALSAHNTLARVAADNPVGRGAARLGIGCSSSGGKGRTHRSPA